MIVILIVLVISMKIVKVGDNVTDTDSNSGSESV